MRCQRAACVNWISTDRYCRTQYILSNRIERRRKWRVTGRPASSSAVTGLRERAVCRTKAHGGGGDASIATVRVMAHSPVFSQPPHGVVASAQRGAEIMVLPGVRSLLHRPHGDHLLDYRTRVARRPGRTVPTVYGGPGRGSLAVRTRGLRGSQGLSPARWRGGHLSSGGQCGGHGGAQRITRAFGGVEVPVYGLGYDVDQSVAVRGGVQQRVAVGG